MNRPEILRLIDDLEQLEAVLPKGVWKHGYTLRDGYTPSISRDGATAFVVCEKGAEGENTAEYLAALRNSHPRLTEHIRLLWKALVRLTMHRTKHLPTDAEWQDLDFACDVLGQPRFKRRGTQEIHSEYTGPHAANSRGEQDQMKPSEVIEEVMFLSVNPGSTFEYEGVRYVLCLDGHQGEFGCYRRCIQMDTGKVNYLGPRKVKLVKHNPESPAIYVPLHKRFTDSEVKVANYRLREQLQLFLDFDPAKVPPNDMKKAQEGAQMLLEFKYQDKPDLDPSYDPDCAVCHGPEETPKTIPDTYEDWRLHWTNNDQRMTWEEAKEIEKRDAQRYPMMRLPTVQELVGLFDYTTGKCRFDIGVVWASEKVPDGTDEYAWSVDLSTGEVMRAVTWDVAPVLWVRKA